MIKKIETFQDLFDVKADNYAKQKNIPVEEVKKRLIDELPYFLAYLKDMPYSKEWEDVKNAKAVCIEFNTGDINIS